MSMATIKYEQRARKCFGAYQAHMEQRKYNRLCKRVLAHIWRAMQFCGDDLNKLAEKVGGRALIADIAMGEIHDNAKEIAYFMMNREHMNPSDGLVAEKDAK